MKSRPRPPIPRAAPGAVRIIGGRWKRRAVPFPDVQGLRPTPNRVRETLFNWLAHAFGGDLSGRVVLDLFAGSGALGFEAASRGAERVVMIDSHPATVEQLQATCALLVAPQIEVHAGDALEWAGRRHDQDRFDVIFLDPPFGLGLLADALPLAAALLELGGFLYVEAEAALAGPGAAGLEPYRADKAGEVFYHLLRRNI